ncbi:MAG TPA: tetratricopeptide repeat protein [Opitutaceae bacterium]|nr:tetratricopeptide repeat protein [Opitutaceae bacterium]
MKPRVRIVAAAGLLLAAAAAAFVGWRASRTAARVHAALPAMPELTNAAPALRERLDAAEARARSTFGARKGLAALSRLYHANGRLGEAQQCYEALERLEPAEPRWPHLRATILAGFGQATDAAALWERTLALAPDYVPARLRLGDVQFKSNQPAAATATYQEVLKRSPDEPYALLGLARLDLEAGRWDDARRRLEAVVAKTNYTLGYDLIVSLYERIGLNDRATFIRAAAKASGAYRDPADPWADELLAECYDPYRLALAAGTIARDGKPNEAKALLVRAVAIAPDDVSARFQLGLLSMEQGDFETARAQFERCTELAPDFADGWARLSELHGRRGDPARADRVLETGLARCPQSPGLHLMRARRMRDTGRTGQAITAFQDSIRLRPNEPEAYLELGAFLIKLGREAEALRLFRGALEAEPGNPPALGVLAFSSISSGQEAEAQRLMTMIREQPRMPRPQVEQLRAAFRQRFGRPAW